MEGSVYETRVVRLKLGGRKQEIEILGMERCLDRRGPEFKRYLFGCFPGRKTRWVGVQKQLHGAVVGELCLGGLHF